MPTPELQSETPEQNFEEARSLIGAVRGDARVVSLTDPNGPLVTVKRTAGGMFEVAINQEKLTQAGKVDVVVAQVLSKIKMLTMQANLASDPGMQKHMNKHLENSQRPAFRLFYQTIYQMIALNEAAIMRPIFQKKLLDLGAAAMKSMSSSKNLPRHIQYLFGLTGLTNGLDQEVLDAIAELNSAHILDYVRHTHNPDDEKLKRIHSYILPNYEYFLRKDKKTWDKNKKKKEPPKPEEVQDEVKKEVEEQLNDTEPPQEVPPEQEDAAAEQDSPERKKNYQTPEGGSFDKDPKGKGYKLEIDPPLNGYYVVDHKNRFDPTTLEWWDTSTAHPYTQNVALKGDVHTLTGVYKGTGKKAIPIPNGYALDINSLQCTGDPVRVMRDSNGAFYLEVSGRSEISISFAEEAQPFIAQPNASDIAPLYAGALSAPTEAAVQQASGLTTNKQKAEALRNFIMKSHKYPKKEKGKPILETAIELQAKLRKMSNGSNYIHNLDASKYLECYSANTLFVALLRTAGVASRVVTGHHVKGVNKNGKSEVNGGNGHGWIEYWNGSTWARFDATPPPEKQEKDDEEEKQDGEEKDKKPSAPPKEANDGGDDTPPPSDEGGEGEGGEQPSDGAEGGDKPDGDGDDAAPEEPFDPDAEFEKMHDELSEDLPDLPTEDEVNDVVQQLDEEWEKEQKRIAEEQKRNLLEEQLKQKYPGLTPEELRMVISFISQYNTVRDQIMQIKNPDRETVAEFPTLADWLKGVYDKVIERSMKKRRRPRYPVAEGDEICDIVGLALALEYGVPDPHVFETTEYQEREHLSVVELWKFKVLDASGSMESGDKLRIQQLIEILDNEVCSQKQAELEDLSAELERDVRLKTETWQFGTADPRAAKTGFVGYRCLKPLSPDFDDLQKAAIWNSAGQTGQFGTNDYDPLEQIEKEIAERNLVVEPGEPTVLERIRYGFVSRELRNLALLEEKEAVSHTPLSGEEKKYLHNLRAHKELFETELENLREKYSQGMDAIVAVVEITTDGGSGDKGRVQRVIGRLRQQGVVVVAYGLGSDGAAVKDTYKNEYNPLEGGLPCANLTEYPFKKRLAWERILDRV